MLLRALLLLLLPLRLALLLALLLLLTLLLALLLALLTLLIALVVQRQVDGEAGAHALLALDVHVAVVAIDDLLHHGKADAQAAALARAAGVRAPEAGEHHLRLVGERPMPVSRTAMAHMPSWLETLTVMVPPSGV